MKLHVEMRVKAIYDKNLISKSVSGQHRFKRNTYGFDFEQFSNYYMLYL